MFEIFESKMRFKWRKKWQFSPSSFPNIAEMNANLVIDCHYHFELLFNLKTFLCVTRSLFMFFDYGHHL